MYTVQKLEPLVMSLNALGCAYSVGLMKPTVPRPALTLAEFTRLTVCA